MLSKNKKNFLYTIKNKIKIKHLIIEKACIQNNSIQINKIYSFNIKNSENKLKELSQLSGLKKKTKKKMFLNRWELYDFFNKNKLINIKQWTK